MSEERNEVVLERAKIVGGKTPRSLVIADDWYLEKLEELKGTSKRKEKNSYKSLIFEDEKIISNWKNSIVVEKTYEDYDGYELTGTLIKIALARPIVIGPNKKDLCDVYVDGRMLQSNSKRTFSYETKELGCDTASFSFYADNQYNEFRTGADGYYGSVITHFEELTIPSVNGKESKIKKDILGYYIEIYLDEDMYEYEEILDIMAYLFQGKIEKQEIA